MSALDDGERLAKNIRDRRESAGLSVRKAAELSGKLISPSGWSRYEDPEKLVDGNLRRSSLIGIARGLGVDAELVFGWAGMDFEPHPDDPKPQGLGRGLAALAEERPSDEQFRRMQFQETQNLRREVDELKAETREQFEQIKQLLAEYRDARD